jgi:hypothetical protein
VRLAAAVHPQDRAVGGDHAELLGEAFGAGGHARHRDLHPRLIVGMDRLEEKPGRQIPMRIAAREAVEFGEPAVDAQQATLHVPIPGATRPRGRQDRAELIARSVNPIGFSHGRQQRAR